MLQAIRRASSSVSTFAIRASSCFSRVVAESGVQSLPESGCSASAAK